jgi:glycosyltransferase involved in cell wall biosynthesis
MLAVSSSVADQFDGADVPVHVVHAGIDGDHAHGPGASGHDWLAAGQPGLLLLGTISRAKGAFVALEAMAHIRSWLPDARLLVVGSGAPATLREVQATIDRLGLQDCVRVEPFTSDPASVMRCSDIVLMPARHEAYGLVTVEAMSAGLPVVGTATGGTKDLLRPGGGLLAGLDDPLHFAGHVYSVATDPTLYAWLCERGRATANALDPEAEARAVDEAVQRLCQSAAGLS